MVSERSGPLWSDAVKQSELRRLLFLPLRNEEDRRRLALWRMFGEAKDSAFLFMFDRQFRCVKCIFVYGKGIRMKDSYAEVVEMEAKEARVRYFAAVHNHVNEPLIPSPDDWVLTNTLLRCGERCFGKREAFLGHFITDGFSVVAMEL